MPIVLDGTTGITTPNVSTDTSTLGPLTQALNLGSTGQIVFPATQNASANANTLDDYEEGTFTITLSPQTSGTITTSTVNVLSYTKIGRVVTVTGSIGVSATSSPVGTFINLNGLPFSTANLTQEAGRVGGAASFQDTSTGALAALPIFILESSTQMRFYINASTVEVNDKFNVSFSYVTD